MDTVVTDLRYALRTLRKSPSYTVIAVLCVALGIGANTTVFSAVNAMILRPQAFDRPERIVRVYETIPRLNITENSLSIANLNDFAAASRTLDGLAAYGDRTFALGGRGEGDEARHVDGEAVSWNLFRLIGIQPVLGRDFAQTESVVGRHQVAILGYKLWQDYFAGDSGILGKTANLDGTPYTVIGVMPRGMRFPETRDIWIPIASDGKESRDARMWDVLGRLKPGATVAEADAELRAVAARLSTAYPETNGGASARAIPFQDALVDEYRSLLWTMLGAVGFVLLIACGNVANLMLARATSRQKEIALRTALGASRSRIVRQLLTESVLISLIGAVFGLLIAVWGLDLIVSAIPWELPYWMHFDIDGRVLTYTTVVATLTGLLFGLVPAAKATNPRLSETLKDGGRGSTASARLSRLRGALVIGEMALCLVLLIGATLMMRSFVRMQTVDPGFRTSGVLSAQVMLPPLRYPNVPERIRFFTTLVERLRATPGVQSAALINYSPLSGSNTGTRFEVEHQAAVRGEGPIAEYRAVSPEYFSTLDLELRAGRTFTAAEATDTMAAVVMVNETLAKRSWPNQSAVGNRIRVGVTGAAWRTVVGVVPNVKQRSLKEPLNPQIYLPYSAFGRRTMTVLLRTDGDPAALATGLRATMRALDPVVPSFEVMSLDAMRRRSMWESRVFGSMFLAFGLVALLLAAVGLYGVMSYGVAQRTHELGVRMALGAQVRDVIGMVVRQGARLAAIGLVIGLPLAFGVTRTLRGQLFGVSTSDPLSYLGIAALLAGIALLASYIPARRAARVDPMVALRSE